MKRSTVSIVVLLMGAVAACEGTSTGNPMDAKGGTGALADGMQLLRSDLPRDVEPEVSADERASLAEGNRSFAFDLYRTLAKPSANLFFSPFSISVALAMTYPGAENDTETQIADTLHFELPEPTLHSAFNDSLLALSARGAQLAEGANGSGFELSVVNQAFGQHGYPFLAPYLDVLAQHYGSGLISVDFADPERTRALINDWVAEQTETRVEELLPPQSLTADTRLVLTNAVYFKANWLSQFKLDDTSDATFESPAGARTVAMMHQVLDARYAERPDYQAVELPYLSPAVRMLFILPAPDQLEAVAAGLNEASFSDLRAGLALHTVELSLPRFEFESEHPLKEPLTALGMSLPFDTAAADFTAIAGGQEQLFIDQVFHKAFVAVDEEGTEAAAATAVVIGTDSAKPPAVITLDRPFIFAIYDEPTGQILFLGQLADPG